MPEAPFIRQTMAPTRPTQGSNTILFHFILPRSLICQSFLIEIGSGANHPILLIRVTPACREAFSGTLNTLSFGSTSSCLALPNNESFEFFLFNYTTPLVPSYIPLPLLLLILSVAQVISCLRFITELGNCQLLQMLAMRQPIPRTDPFFHFTSQLSGQSIFLRRWASRQLFIYLDLPSE